MFKYFAGLLCDLSLVIFLPFIRLWKFLDNREYDTFLFIDKPSIDHGLLLVHGSGANEGQFLISRKIIDNILKEKGVECRVYSLDLNGFSASQYESIDDYAKKLIGKVKKIEEDGVKKLTIVGHSMGGLVASHYVENYCTNKQIIKCVCTIGTPWHGVPLLKYIYGLPFINSKRYLDMIPNSDFLKQLHEKVYNSNVVYKTIGSKWDMQVPYGYYSLKGVKNNASNIDTIFGHTSVIMAPSTWKYILKDL